MIRVEGKRHYAKATVAWAEQWDSCWRCRRRGVWKHGLTIHHITRGSNRQANNLATTTIACGDCHSKEETTDSLGEIGWIVLKRWHDKAHYNLLRVLRAWDKVDGFITEADVDEAEAKLIERGILPWQPWKIA